MKFGEKLRMLRLMKNLTQDELAEQLETSKQVISRYETGRRTPKIDVADEYARILNIPLEVLINDEVWLDAESGLPFKPLAVEGDPEPYYLNPETQKIAEQIYQDKELRLLFDAAKDADPEDLEFVHEWLLHRKEQEHNRDVE